MELNHKVLDCPRVCDRKIAAAISRAVVEVITRLHTAIRGLWWRILTCDDLFWA